MNDSGADPAVGTGGREQRLLAAIVFTDVVGFSRLTAKNEARVYVALQRDMGIMTDLCRAHGGQVLNTMGDGMLLSFPSAVDAMACAVEIQRTLAAQAQSLPQTDILHHRIGVHLGDIIVKGDNVFGDGVNTAARLQTDARPDSIWYSDTVHKVIKNRLKFDARYVGPRQFKNLTDRVSVWEVPPILEARAQQEADALGVGTATLQTSTEGVRGGRAFLLILASLILLGAVAFMVSQMKAPAAQVRIKPPVDKPAPPVPSATTTAGEGTTSGTTGTPIPTPPPTVGIDAARAEVERLKSRYDFAGVALYVAGDGKVLPDAETLAMTYVKLAAFRAWIETEIYATTPADPIVVQLSQGLAEIHGTPTGPQIQFDKAGFQPFDLTNLPAVDFLAVAQALELRPSASKPAELAEQMGYFRQEYGL